MAVARAASEGIVILGRLVHQDNTGLGETLWCSVQLVSYKRLSLCHHKLGGGGSYVQPHVRQWQTLRGELGLTARQRIAVLLRGRAFYGPEVINNEMASTERFIKAHLYVT